MQDFAKASARRRCQELFEPRVCCAAAVSAAEQQQIDARAANSTHCGAQHISCCMDESWNAGSCWAGSPGAVREEKRVLHRKASEGGADGARTASLSSRSPVPSPSLSEHKSKGGHSDRQGKVHSLGGGWRARGRMMASAQSSRLLSAAPPDCRPGFSKGGDFSVFLPFHVNILRQLHEVCNDMKRFGLRTKQEIEVIWSDFHISALQRMAACCSDTGRCRREAPCSSKFVGFPAPAAVCSESMVE